MPDVWPVTIRTPDGDIVEVDFTPSGRVWIGTSSAGAWLNAAKREEFGRAYIAASWAAEGRVTERQDTRPATDPPLHYDEGITGMHWDSLGSVSDD